MTPKLSDLLQLGAEVVVKTLLRCACCVVVKLELDFVKRAESVGAIFFTVKGKIPLIIAVTTTQCSGISK